MNLAGHRPAADLVRTAALEGEQVRQPATITDLIPDRVTWIVWQLWLVGAAGRAVEGRRLGPLVAEDLPVVVRASETVEGRGRLYRSRRARDRAADGAAHRDPAAPAAATRLRAPTRRPPPSSLPSPRARRRSRYALHTRCSGPPPATDADLVHLAHALDDIERQVAHS